MEIQDTLDRVKEFWNKGDPQGASDVYADDFVFHSTTLDEPLHGREALFGYIKQLRNAFPDFRLNLDEVVTEGDKLAVRWTWTGTHQGDFEGIPPTGRKVTQTGMTLVKRMSGKTVEEFVATDQYSLLQQIGVVPARPSQVKTRRAG